MKNVLVTGGAGFVGSNLVRILVSEYGCNVTVIDDLFTGNLDNIRTFDIEFVHGSIVSQDLLVRHMKGKDTVFHLAARNIIASIEDPLADLETNVKGTFYVFEQAMKCDVERVVYTSTSSIYGNSRHMPVCEDECPGFLNFYSCSKYAGEAYAQTFNECHGLPVAVVRYSNVFGYNQHPQNPYSGVVGKFIEWALKNEPLMVHGDGAQTRDFTFVDDACRATILAALSSKAVGEIYNIGTGLETSVLDLAQHILQITGSSSPIQHQDKRIIDNIRRRVLNIEKARRHLRYTPSWTLRKGLEATVEWYEQSSRSS